MVRVREKAIGNVSFTIPHDITWRSDQQHPLLRRGTKEINEGAVCAWRCYISACKQRLKRDLLLAVWYARLGAKAKKTNVSGLAAHGESQTDGNVDGTQNNVKKKPSLLIRQSLSAKSVRWKFHSSYSSFIPFHSSSKQIVSLFLRDSPEKASNLLRGWKKLWWKIVKRDASIMQFSIVHGGKYKILVDPLWGRDDSFMLIAIIAIHDSFKSFGKRN